MKVLDVLKVISRLEIAKINIDYAVRLNEETEQEESEALQKEINDLLDLEVSDSNGSLDKIIEYLENNEAQISTLNESAVYIALVASAGQN